MLSKSVDLLWLTGKPVQQLQLLLQQHTLSSRHCVTHCCCCWSVTGCCCCCWLYRNSRHQTPAMPALLIQLLLLLLVLLLLHFLLLLLLSWSFDHCLQPLQLLALLLAQSGNTLRLTRQRTQQLQLLLQQRTTSRADCGCRQRRSFRSALCCCF